MFYYKIKTNLSINILKKLSIDIYIKI